MIIMGIDPGQQTGIAIFQDGKLKELHTTNPEVIFDLIATRKPNAVVFEDSRLTSPVWGRGVSRAALIKIARNVGMVDGICAQITRACEAVGVVGVGVSPKNKGAKLNAEQFKAATGWATRSNQHERDAAMVAWPKRSIHIGGAN